MKKTIKIITEEGVVTGSKITRIPYGGVRVHWIDGSTRMACSDYADKIESLDPKETWYRCEGVKWLSPAEEIDLDERSKINYDYNYIQ